MGLAHVVLSPGVVVVKDIYLCTFGIPPGVGFFLLHNRVSCSSLHVLFVFLKINFYYSAARVWLLNDFWFTRYLAK